MPLYLSRSDARELASVCTAVAERTRRDLERLPIGYEQAVAGLRARAERMERLAALFATMRTAGHPALDTTRLDVHILSMVDADHRTSGDSGGRR